MVRKTKSDALVTRQQLISAAIEQFALRGVTETTLTDIADAAGVTRGAVYWHFKSKAEIFNEMWSQQLPIREIIQHRLTQNEKENPFAFMKEMFVVALQYICQTPKQQALMQILYHKCEFSKDMLPESEIRQRLFFRYGKIRSLLNACVCDGSLPADTDIETALIILHSFFSGVLKNWLLEPQKFNLFQRAPALVDSIMSTLRPKMATPPLNLNTLEIYRAAV